MNISVIQEDGTENEFEVAICCVDCASIELGWRNDQYNFIIKKVNNNESINVPNHIDSLIKFKNYIKTL